LVQRREHSELWWLARGVRGLIGAFTGTGMLLVPCSRRPCLVAGAVICVVVEEVRSRELLGLSAW
jgi:hypothetical protein